MDLFLLTRGTLVLPAAYHAPDPFSLALAWPSLNP